MTARSAFGIALAAAGLVALTSLAGACGGPALQSAPRPNSAIIAGAAAATAGAITLANPDGAAAYVEDEERYHRAPGPDPAPVKVVAPAAVFDRLDAAERAQRAERPQPPGGAGPGDLEAPAAAPTDSPDAAPAAPAVPPSVFFKLPRGRTPDSPQLEGFRKPGSSPPSFRQP